MRDIMATSLLQNRSYNVWACCDINYYVLVLFINSHCFAVYVFCSLLTAFFGLLRFICYFNFGRPAVDLYVIYKWSS
jgi:hypothetical protein